MKKKVEFEINPAKVMGWMATIIGVLTAGYAMASWIDDAEEAHELAASAPPPPYYEALETEQEETESTLDLLKQNQLQLQQQEIIRQEIWGDNYKQRINEVLNQNETGSE
jgi:H+/gluconate symporter-like permease